MRGEHKMLWALAVTTVSVGVAMGQGFGGFGGGGPGGGNDPAALLRMEAIRKELKVTDEQMKKLPEAVWKALGDVLDADQQKRLRQITLQLRGTEAFRDPKIQTALKLTGDQKEGIQTALDEQKKEIEDLGPAGFGGGKFDFKGFQERQEKMQAIRKGTMEKITGLLTSAQKTQWNEMVGEEFKMPAFGFGKGFKGKGFKGKKGAKKDDE